MSALTKTLLAIGGLSATVYACIVGHRMMTKPNIEQVAKNFSEIFRKNVSKEEAEKLVKKYEDIINIEDMEEFYKKAFEQVKKDYGYEKLPITLEIQKLERGSGNAGWQPEFGQISIDAHSIDGKTISSLNKRGRKVELQTIMHEFQHIKQHEIGYRTSRDSLAEALHFRRFDTSEMILNIKNILKNKAQLEKLAKKDNKTIEEVKKGYEKILQNLQNGKYSLNEIKFDKNERIILDDLFEHLPKYEHNSEEYKLGEKYIDNTKHYIRPKIDHKAYEKQILEAEATACEDKFDKIYQYFANPWRCPGF